MTLLESMSAIEIGALIIGTIMVGEGIVLMLISKKLWEEIRTYLAKMTIGQVHTVAFFIIVIGVVHIIFAKF